MKSWKKFKNIYFFLFMITQLIILANNFIFTLNLNYGKKNDNININFSQLNMQLQLKIKTFTKFTEEFQSLEKSEITYENFYNNNNENIEKNKNFLNFSTENNNNKENNFNNLNFSNSNKDKNQEQRQETRNIYAYYTSKPKKKIQFTSKLSKESENNLIATGIYKRTRYYQGWDKLRIKTFSIGNGNPLLQCFSAGFIEGAISTQEIYHYYKNIHVFFKGSKKSIEDIKNFYSVVDQNIRNRLKKENFLKSNLNDDEFKRLAYIACLHAQINGLFQGYNSQAKEDKKLGLLDFYFINSEGKIDKKNVIFR